MPPLPPIPHSMPTTSEPRFAARMRGATAEPSPGIAGQSRRDFADALCDARRPDPATHTETAHAERSTPRDSPEEQATESGNQAMRDEVMAEPVVAAATTNIGDVIAASPVPLVPSPQAAPGSACALPPAKDGAIAVSVETTPHLAPAVSQASGGANLQAAMPVATAAPSRALNPGTVPEATASDTLATTPHGDAAAADETVTVAPPFGASPSGRTQGVTDRASTNASIAAGSELLVPLLPVSGHGERAVRSHRAPTAHEIDTRRSGGAGTATDEHLAARAQSIKLTSGAELPSPASSIPAAARAMQVESAIRMEHVAAQGTPPTELNNAMPGGAAAMMKLAAPGAPAESIGAAFQMPVAEDGSSTAVTGQALRGLSAMVNQRGGSMTLRLDPPDLGDLRIRMTISHGVVTADFQAGLPHTHALLDRGLAALRQALEAQGLTVERLSVHVAASHASAPQPSSVAREDSSAQQQWSSQHDAGGSESRGRREHPAESQQELRQATEFNADDLTFESLLGHGAPLQHLVLAGGGSRT